jgi:hypothetical protein
MRIDEAARHAAQRAHQEIVEALALVALLGLNVADWVLAGPEPAGARSHLECT